MPRRKKALPIDPARNILEVISSLRDQLRNSDQKVANLVLQKSLPLSLMPPWRRPLRSAATPRTTPNSRG